MIEAWLTWIQRVLEVALGIGLVIFVHELGHFLVAKKVGIRVETFSLGFGPRLFGFRRGGTDYRVSAVPLGGYVKMAGENPDEPSTGAQDEFASKPVGARAAVIVAGVCMNAIFAVVGFLVAFKVGVRMDEAAVGRVQPGSAAEAAGLRYADRVVKIDDETPLEFMDLGLAAAYASGPLDLTVERRGELLHLRVTPRRTLGSPVQQLGFERMVQVDEVAPGSAAERAALRKGDWVVGAAGKPVASFDEFETLVEESPGRELPVEVRREGRYERLKLTPDARPLRTYGIALAPTPVVASVIAGTPAAEAGLQPGDVILEVGGAPAEAATFRDRIASGKPGEPVKLAIERAGARKEIVIVPQRDGADGTGPLIIGIRYGASRVGEVKPGSPAALAGIERGDRIVEMSGGPHPSISDAYASSREADENPLTLKVAKKGSGEVLAVKLAPAPVRGKTIGDAGIEIAAATFEKKVPGVVEPVVLGFNRTYMFTEQVFLTFQGMFTKRIDPSTLGGPIGIAETAYRVSVYGLGKLLYFLAIISVNLAVLNIFPIPVLDGGHLVFLAIEKVRGAPVAPSVQAAAQWVGLAALLGLMIFVTKNDIMRTFFGG